MRNLNFTTFYTYDTIYEKSYYNLLLPSLKKFNLKRHSIGIKNLGSWNQNTIQKPKIILETMNIFSEDIIWIDSDAEICKYPNSLFEISDDVDIGVHYLSWEKHYGRNSDKNKFEMVDGTIYIKNTNKMKKFIELWKQQSTDIGINHQAVLGKMIKEHKNINCWDIGWENCYIESTPQGNPPFNPLNKENIIILHTQMSRVAKNKGLS